MEFLYFSLKKKVLFKKSPGAIDQNSILFKLDQLVTL